MAPSQPEYIVLGAGVIGLTTALVLKDKFPDSKITILAKHMPGDRSVEYCSPWAGANWLSVCCDGGPMETWERDTFLRFTELERRKETGVKGCEIRGFFDEELAESGIMNKETGEIWWKDLVSDFRFLTEEEVDEKVDLEGKTPKWGFEAKSFVVDTGVYLAWLQTECLKLGINMRRKVFSNIHEIFASYPNAKAYFNCTGLGSHSLKGVEDKDLYPTRGQVLLVTNPTNPPLERMYFRSPKRTHSSTTYVFPRRPGGGVVLGGCRMDGNWDGVVDEGFSEDIKRRCCILAPELGKPEELVVLGEGVGLRPSRIGGARIQREGYLGKHLVIHNYGAGGAGYQASWGMAKEAVGLLPGGSQL